MGSREPPSSVISTNDLRFQFKRVLHAMKVGHPLVLTYRNKAIARIEPIRKNANSIAHDDPLFDLCSIAEPMERMTNKDLDETLYG